ncbi:hypothetical protein ENUP19_0254G0028 [Entamoeba nuttalli]|uniref:Dedicator of cytokinesis protein n=2 Tax=Entamoeba nuttalli TaxID=412467 RepID=K2GFW9_ENTNP|nr:hypothetical protein ENU1_050760 [Entamoeba nuttalli P19]EKE41596.1 hypothetical protein ENU1_050760 [Entamoeba nuttalli P19]|eukprot:XP_008856077.1 hypothetical protein ENU1_050760 [Entamoeba nuttalli P19]
MTGMDQADKKDFLDLVFGEIKTPAPVKICVSHAKTKTKQGENDVLYADSIVSFKRNDTEGTGELDVYQIKQCLSSTDGVSTNQRYNLTEAQIKQLFNERFTDKSCRVDQKEFCDFIIYLKSISERLKEYSKQKNIYDIYADQFKANTSISKLYNYFDENDFTLEKINGEHNGITISFPLTGDASTISYLKLIEQQFYGERIVIREKQTIYSSINPSRLSDFAKTEKCKNYMRIFGNEKIEEGIESKESVDQKESDKDNIQLDVKMVDIIERSNRRKENPNLFDFYNPVFSTGSIVSESVEVPMKMNDDRKPFVFEYTLGGDGEQIVSSFCLLEANSKRKLTADYFVELNRKTDTFDVLNQINPVVIRLWPYDIENGDLWVLVKHYKSADNDIEAIKDMYEKGLEDKKGKKYKEKIATSKIDVQREQLLVIGLMPVNKMFKEKKGQLLNIKFYREDIENEKRIFELIDDVKNKKAKEIDLRCWLATIRFTTLEDWKEAQCHLYLGNERLTELENIQKIKEEKVIDVPVMEDLIENEELCDIYDRYSNKLIIYPNEVSIGKERKRSGIVIKVCLRDNDSNIGDESLDLKLFYPQKSNIRKGEVEMTSNRITSFSHTKIGQFLSELKVELPFPLKKTHHLLFTITDVSAEETGNSSKPLYAYYSFFEDGFINETKKTGSFSILKSLNGEVTLPILKNPSKNYLQHTEFYETSKYFLKIKLNGLSSVYPQSEDTYKLIHYLIKYAENESDDQLVQQIKNISEKIPSTDCVHFFPVIMNGLLNVNKILLEPVLTIVDKVSNFEQKYYRKNMSNPKVVRHPVLSKYLQYHCTCQDSCPNTLVMLLKSQLSLTDQAQTISKVFSHIWFLFEVIIHSLIKYLDKQNALKDERGKWFDPETIKNNKISYNSFKKLFLQAFTPTFSQVLHDRVFNKMYKNLAEANAAYVRFLMKLFRILGRSEVMGVFEYHLKQLSLPYVEVKNNFVKYEQTSEEVMFLTVLRLDSLNLFSKFPYIELLALPDDIEMKDNDIGMLGDIVLEKYFPVYLLIRQYLLISQKSTILSKMGIYSLVAFLQRLDLDAKLQNKKGIISNMLLGIVLRLIDDNDSILDWENKRCRENDGIEDVEMISICFFFVLKNMDDKTLKSWLTGEVPSRVKIIVNIIRRSLMLLSRYPLPLFKDVEPEVEEMRERVINDITKENETKEITIKEPMQIIHIKKRRPSQAPTEEMLKEQELENKNKVDRRRKIMSISIKRNEYDFLHHYIIYDCVMVTLDALEILYERTQQEESATEGSDNESKTALGDIENIINNVLFDCPMNSKYAEQLFAFVRKILSKYCNYIFTKRVDFSFQLLKNIIKLCSSENDKVCQMALQSLYIFSKINFVCDKDLSKISNHIVCALSQLQSLMKNKNKFERTISQLISLPQKDFNSSREIIMKLIKIYKEQGIYDTKYLFRIQQLELGVAAGATDEFLTFLNNVVKLHQEILEPLDLLNADLINGYTTLKLNICDFFPEHLRVRGIDVKKIKMRIEEKFKECCFVKLLSDRCTSLIEQFKVMMGHLSLIDKRSRDDQKEAIELEEIFRKHMQQSLETLNWVIKVVMTKPNNNVPNEMMSENLTIEQLRTLRVMRENEANQIKKEAEERLEKYKEVMETTGQKNPYFPIEDKQFSDILELVEQLFEQKLVLVKESIECYNMYEEKKKELELKRKEVMNEIEDMHSSVTKNLYDQPLGDSYTNSTLQDFSRVQDRFAVSDDTVEKQNEHLMRQQRPWCLRFEYWKQILPMSASIVEKVNVLIKKIEANERRMTFKKQWHSQEREFAVNAIKLYEWSKTVELLMKEKDTKSNEYMVWLSKIANDCLGEKEEMIQIQKNVHEEFDNLKALVNAVVIDMKRANNRRRQTRKSIALAEGEQFNINASRLSTDSNNSEGSETSETYLNMEPFGSEFMSKCDSLIQEGINNIDELAKFFEERKVIEEGNNNKRQEYFGLLVQFSDLKKELTVEDKDFFSKVQNLKSIKKNIDEMEKMEIPEINAYCDYTLIPVTVTNNFKDINDMVLQYSKQEEPKKEEKSNKKKEIKIVEDEERKYFLNENDRFRYEAFLDVNEHKQIIFEHCIDDMDQEMRKMINKLVELDELSKKSNDPEFLIQKFYESTIDYEHNPRLHLTWFNKMAAENRKNLNFVEAGMCELHMVHYIYCHIANRSNDLPIQFLTEICEDFLSEDKVVELQENNDCSFESMIVHIKQGVKDFDTSHLYNYALALCNFELPYYEQILDYRKLAECHATIQKLYKNMDVKDNTVDIYSGYFFHVEFVGEALKSLSTPFGYIYRSQKPLKDFNKELKSLIAGAGIKDIPFIDKNEHVDDSVTNYVKVKAVFPMIDNEPIRDPQTLLTNTKLFVFEDDSGPKTDILKRSKERYVLTTSLSMPCGLKRQQVVDKEVTKLTPIQNVTDILSYRLDKLTSTLSSYQDLKLAGKEDSAKLKNIQTCVGNLLQPKQKEESVYAITETFLSSGFYTGCEVPSVSELFTILQRICEIIGASLDTLKKKINNDDCKLHQKMFEEFRQLILSLENEINDFIEKNDTN